MKVAGAEKIAKFTAKHPESKASFDNWLFKVRDAKWATPMDVHQTFTKADFVDGKAVFNVGGNNFRVIARIVYALHQVILLYVLTHDEYSKDKWK